MEERNALRLAKLLAQRGIASRREAEGIIREGRVTVNGVVVTTPAVDVDPESDHVKLDGRNLPAEPPRVYLLMYKPRGYITGREDPEGRPSVFDLLEDLKWKVEPVGRLDFDTEGALILTNDGELAHALTHPSGDVPKRYVAKVYRTPDERDLEAIEKGVYLDEGRAKPAKARVLESTKSGNAKVEITVTEGRNRLVRRIFAQLKHPVSKLRRESFGTISIRGMERGQVRRLLPEEIRRLQDLASGKNPSRAGRVKSRKGFAKAKPKTSRMRRKKD